jgi:cytochrome c biogenesis protein CcmG, thiol:disulfide interchange protein DsbE
MSSRPHRAPRRLGAGLVALLAIAVGCDRGPQVAIGKPVPAYSAVTLDGRAVSLADLRGRPVLLNIWATWCRPCRDEMPYLQSLYEEHKASGFEIIGVSIDTDGEEQTVRDYATRLGVTYPVWFDPDQRVSNVFLAVGVPASYLIGRDGTLLWRRIGMIRPGDDAFLGALRAAIEPG